MATYRNLVFKGGGVRGIAYLGAMDRLYRNGLMRRIERTAGTSAGAITATVVALNYPRFEDLKAVADSLEYRRVPSKGDLPAKQAALLKKSPLLLQRQFQGLSANMQCSLRFLQEKGWYSSQYLYGWLRDLIAGRFAVRKDAYTFRDFRDAGLHVEGRPFLDLYVTGTDISNRTSRVFSYDTTPDMEVALAVRISMSIPIFFESVEFRYPGTAEPQLYADGGIMWNYPIGLFDGPSFSKKPGANPETLGLFVFHTPTDADSRGVRNTVQYVGALFETLLLVQERLVLQEERRRGRTIFIDDGGIASTDFDVEPGDASYLRLYRSGEAAAEEFCADGRKHGERLIRSIQEVFGWKGAED